MVDGAGNRLGRGGGSLRFSLNDNSSKIPRLSDPENFLGLKPLQRGYEHRDRSHWSRPPWGTLGGHRQSSVHVALHASGTRSPSLAGGSEAGRWWGVDRDRYSPLRSHQIPDGP